MKKSGILVTAILISLLAAACGKKAPPAALAVVDAQRGAAATVATEAAKSCADLFTRTPLPADASKVKPMPASPAKGTSLETEVKVREVFIMCNRAAGGATSEGTGFPGLKGLSSVPKLAVTMPADRVSTTCKDDANDPSCEWLIVPSRYLDTPSSADLHVRRPSPSGYVEVTVVVDAP